MLGFGGYSIRKAWRDWRRLEQELTVTRQELDRQYHRLLGEALESHLDLNEGLLSSAQALLEAPLMDERILRLQQSLNFGFQFWGRGLFSYFRKLPHKMNITLKEYANLLEEKGQRFLHLTKRLGLSERILHEMRRTEGFGAEHHIRLALISPEVAEVLLRLWHRRKNNLLKITYYLNNIAKKRISIIYSWINVLDNQLPQKEKTQIENSTKNIGSRIHKFKREDFIKLIKTHKELNKSIEKLDRYGKANLINTIDRIYENNY